MRTPIADLEDCEYDDVVLSWEEYAGVTTAELMEKYDTSEIDSTMQHADESGVMNIIEFYHLDDSINVLREHILESDDFKDSCTCDNFAWAVDMFLENIEHELLNGDRTYFIPFDDLGIPWLLVDCEGDPIYWNMEDIFDHWLVLNKENYFNQ